MNFKFWKNSPNDYVGCWCNDCMTRLTNVYLGYKVIDGNSEIYFPINTNVGNGYIF